MTENKCYVKECNKPIWMGACEKHTKEEWLNIKRREREYLINSLTAYIGKAKAPEVRAILQKLKAKLEPQKALEKEIA